MNQVKEPTKGFVVVATKEKQFLIGADNLKESILDHYEDAKITLFTEQKFIDDPDCKLYFRDFDKVLATPGDHTREKMWGMANSPYDLTFYIDADCEIMHTDIENSFDRLEGNDMVFVELKRETKGHFADWDWGDGDLDHLTHCGGICLYDTRNPLVVEFMNDWYYNYKNQKENLFNPDEYQGIPERYKAWDQLTLWYQLWHDPKYKSIKWKFFDDNYRWNYYSSFGFNKDGTHNYGVVDPVIVHYSSWMDKTGDKGFL
jgi:hypothetical protein